MKTNARTLAMSLLLTALLPGCASMNDMTMSLLSSTAPALAVIDARVFAGEVRLYTDRTGTVDLLAAEPAISCAGNLRYTASTSGVVNLRCSDGSEALLPFTALGETSGHASGPTARGTASLTYGLPPEQARAWLTAPAGKRLVVNGERLDLE